MDAKRNLNTLNLSAYGGAFVTYAQKTDADGERVGGPGLIASTGLSFEPILPGPFLRAGVYAGYFAGIENYRGEVGMEVSLGIKFIVINKR